MARYFAEAPSADAAWAVFFLTGRRLKRLVPYSAIHGWTLADRTALLDPGRVLLGRGRRRRDRGAGARSAAAAENIAPLPLAAWVEERILSLRTMAHESAQVTWWAPLDWLQRFVLLKMITGELRVGVSQTLVVRALARPPACRRRRSRRG